LLGFTVPENFRRPYLASNISEFWRRWHISLSSWLRDYLYIPLGGNRRHRDRNLLITMILGGLWHGANLTFIVWGTMHGALLVAYWRFETWRRGSPTRDWPWGRRLMGFAGWALTFVLVSTAFVFFRASSVDQALSMLGFMYGWLVNGAQVLSLHQRLAVAGIISGWLVFEVIQELLERRRATAEAVEGAVGWRPRAWPRELWAAGYVLLFVVTFLLTPSSAPRFIYFQF
jgi:alginate O-acetyltransferase complex protein AlgI